MSENEIRSAVAAAIQRRGISETSKDLGLNRATVASLAAGAKVHPSTLTHVKTRIAALAGAEAK